MPDIPSFEPPQPINGETFTAYWQRFIADLTRYIDQVTSIMMGEA